jgi:serine/threonine protein kinase
MWLIVMEYLGGGTLWDRFTKQGVRSDEACAITIAMCAALAAAHEQDVLHRDVKPENILFTSEGVPRLADFGIAKNTDTDMRRTRVGDVVGTPAYMSPEQATGEELTRACDVYSAAVVLYELLAGRLPFEEALTPTQQLIQHAAEPPLHLAKIAPDVPGAIADVVMGALEKRPENRPETAEVFGVALGNAAGDAYGPEWLTESGVRLMAGGPIEAAAHRSPTVGVRAKTPTLTQPALRADHFRPDTTATGGAEVSNVAMTDASTATGPPVDPTVATLSPFVPPGGPPAEEQDAASPAEPPTPSPSGESATLVGSSLSSTVSSSSSEHRSRRGLITVLASGAALGALALLIFGFGWGQGDDETAAASPSDTAAASPSDAPATTRELSAVGTASQDDCARAARCAVIDSARIDGDSFVIEWTAVGFEPSFEEGFFHVHFFWDIYSAGQAGTNARTFGMTEGFWERTAQQPFRSNDELLVANQPSPANRICVTPVNFAHAVVDPLQFDCITIPTKQVLSTSTTTQAASTSTTESTTTTEPPFACAGGFCAHIDEVSVEDDELIIEWTAHGYVPDTSNLHAHFYYDIYDVTQVGTNWQQMGAATAGSWQLTDDQPFRTAGSAVAISNAPPGTTAICVVPTDSNHGVLSPDNAECFELPPELVP